MHLDGRTTVGQTLRDDVIRCLAAAADTYPLGEAEHQVKALVCDTLKEYKCLEGCATLRR